MTDAKEKLKSYPFMMLELALMDFFLPRNVYTIYDTNVKQKLFFEATVFSFFFK